MICGFLLSLNMNVVLLRIIWHRNVKYMASVHVIAHSGWAGHRIAWGLSRLTTMHWNAKGYPMPSVVCYSAEPRPTIQHSLRDSHQDVFCNWEQQSTTPAIPQRCLTPAHSSLPTWSGRSHVRQSAFWELEGKLERWRKQETNIFKETKTRTWSSATTLEVWDSAVIL